MLAVIPLVSLTDRRPARQLYLASSVLSALSCFGMALCDSLLPALGFRALAGIAMAGMYCPDCGRSRAASKDRPAPASRPGTRAPSPSASLSFLFGRVGTLLGWRSAFVIAGILGAAQSARKCAANPNPTISKNQHASSTWPARVRAENPSPDFERVFRKSMS